MPVALKLSQASSIVKESCAWVANHATHVSINYSGTRNSSTLSCFAAKDRPVKSSFIICHEIENLAEELSNSNVKMDLWDYEGIHYFDNGPLTVQYLFVLDALNFCFWPDANLHYHHLAMGLRSSLLADQSSLNSDRLQSINGKDLRKLLNWPRELPLEDERARLLREVGTELNRSFGGKASNLVTAANASATTLVHMIASHFPGFRDHCVYKGHQVFVYKRAQIFVADIWGSFKGEGFGCFKDIKNITMFADYIVPTILRHHGILSYSTSLSDKVDKCKELEPGTEEEVEIRACTITAVEQLVEKLSEKKGKMILAVQVDWLLWATGIARQSELPFHRTRTIYY